MRTVLIIEDNNDILENMREILELANYSVRVAKNGQEGILVSEQTRPSVILCDIMMPGFNGYEVLDTLKKNDTTRNIPFIFVTASTEKNDVAAAMQKGADGYIKKPFEAETLVNIVNSFVRE